MPHIPIQHRPPPPGAVGLQQTPPMLSAQELGLALPENVPPRQDKPASVPKTGPRRRTLAALQMKAAKLDPRSWDVNPHSVAQQMGLRSEER